MEMEGLETRILKMHFSLETNEKELFEVLQILYKTPCDAVSIVGDDRKTPCDAVSIVGDNSSKTPCHFEEMIGDNSCKTPCHFEEMIGGDRKTPCDAVSIVTTESNNSCKTPCHFEEMIGDDRKTPHNTIQLLTLLYKQIAHTRDIVNGKGEYTNAYKQLYVWNSVFPELAKHALETFVLPQPLDYRVKNHWNPSREELKLYYPEAIPYGSWKDIKYLCEFCRMESKSVYHPLIQHSIRIITQQLWMDSTETDPTRLSLVAKWIPREHSKYGWLFNLLVKDYFAPYYEKAKTPEAKFRANKKAKMNYRKLIAQLNRRLDTVQIKQCANDWGNIDPETITAITAQRQKRAFLNRKKNGSQRTIKDDRVECAEQFRYHLEREICLQRTIPTNEKPAAPVETLSPWNQMKYLLENQRYERMAAIIADFFH
jgi:hypothetical protein